MMEQNQGYQAAMKEAASAAWDQDWQRAIEAYQSALQIAPADAQALAGLALAQLEVGDYDAALASYQNVSKLVASDPLPREKMAEIYEGRGDYQQAAREHEAAGEIYFARKDLKRAIPHWEQAVRLNEDQARSHMRLAVIFERDKERRPDAVYEYLHVARLLQKMGQNQRAEQALQRAQNIDSINPDVRNALDDLKRGNAIDVPDVYEDRPVSTAPQTDVNVEDLSDEQEQLLEAIEEGEKSRTPVEEATRHAMGLLADSIWTGDVPPQAQTTLLQGIDAHQIGETDDAMKYFKQAHQAGFDHPALNFTLGVLYQLTLQFDDTIEMLEGTTEEPAYAVASHMMLGQAYYAKENLQTASRHMLHALKSADAHLNPQQVDEGGYERIMSSLYEQPDDYLTELSKALTFYLDDAHWRDKLQKTLDNYAAQRKASYVADLIELMIEGGRPELGAIMQRVDEYIEQDMLHLASEEIHYAIERAPDYLPAHRRLVDILIKEARTQEAATKLNLIANTYKVRGNVDKAADLFAYVIDLWPADTQARERVINMMREQGRTAEALRHYNEMAELYFRLMADPDKAIQVYNEALSYAQEAQADPANTVPILKSLADIEGQRLNWRKALNYYERVREIVPSDEDAALGVVNLYFQLGETSLAVKALDNYMRLCISQGDVGRVTSVLEDQVRQYPEIIPLRARLAEVYRQQGRKQDAITQLDALGELQLDVGNMEAATATIRKIISMDPPDAEGYRSLLRQLESGSL